MTSNPRSVQRPTTSSSGSARRRRGSTAKNMSRDREQLKKTLATVRVKLESSTCAHKSQLLKELTQVERHVDTFVLNSLQADVLPKERRARMHNFLAPILIKVDQALQEGCAATE